MTIAQGIFKRTVFAKQTAKGSPVAGAGGQVLRVKTAVFKEDRDTFEHDEKTDHMQSTGVGYGIRKPTGKIDALVSPGTWKLPLASLLRADFAAVTAYSAGSDVTAQAAAPQFTDASGGYLTGGLKVGMIGRWTGFVGSPGSGNNSRNFLITALTASAMTGVFLDGGVAFADTAGDAVTFTVVGKVSKAATASHTDDWFTFEEWYSDTSLSELYGDCQFSKAEIGLPPTGDATIALEVLGAAKCSEGSSQILTSPTAVTTTNVLNGAGTHGAVYVDGALVANCTNIKLTIDGGKSMGAAELGTDTPSTINRGKLKVSGEFAAKFSSSTLNALYKSETPVSLIAVAQDSALSTSDFVAFTLGRIKLTGNAPDDGEKEIVRTYPFTAEINSAGGANLAWDFTILSIQDSQA